jgi:hypothetical protein
MATALSSLLTQTRQRLLEPTASFWTDAELLAIMNHGIRDLWRAVNDTYQGYNWATDTSVTQGANAVTLTNVPDRCANILGIEPYDRAALPNLHYRPKEFTHPDFSNARAESAFDASSGGTIWYDRVNAGAPVGAPTIYVAPKVTADIQLRLTYIPTFAVDLTASDDNPIPGESDEALIAWTVAYARAKERDARTPDETWLQVYSTEKGNIIQAITPDQQDEPDVVDALFENYWQT